MYNDRSEKYLKDGHSRLDAIDIDEYKDALGKRQLEEIKIVANSLENKSWAHVNSTFEGGGVAEMLRSVIPITKGLGIDCIWHCLEGNDDFFAITKGFHNAIQGVRQDFTMNDLLDTYVAVNEKNFENYNVKADMILVHDPQPLASVVHGRYDGKLLWRCHIDTTEADQHIWNFLLPYINNFDMAVFSHEDFVRKGIKAPVIKITPAIDPLSPKNRQRTHEEALNTLGPLLNEHDIDPDRPMILAVSRYDIHKNQKTIIKAFKEFKNDPEVKKKNPILVMVGNLASDDPEGQGMYDNILELIDNDPDIYALLNIPNNDENIGALMKIADVFVHISTKEGFGLVVTEAMWQGTPVIGSSVGGIRLQVIDGNTGFVVDPFDEKKIVSYLKYMITDKDERDKMGINAMEHVRENFLIPTLVKNYLNLMRLMLRTDSSCFTIT